MTEKRTTESGENSHPRPTCNHSGCTTPMARNNTIGYCRRHRGDAKLVPQVCKRVGCSMRLTIRSKTGYCELHKSDANTGKPPLTEKELKERQVDDRWELHHDETDAVACRICGKRMQVLGSKGKKNHLLEEHGLTVREYHQYCQSRGWGTPQVSSLKTQKAITEWKGKHPEKVEGYKLAKNAKDKVRRATDPEFVKHEGDLIRKRAQAKLTEDDKKVRVRCEVPDRSSGLPCGEWYRWLGKHLWSIHHMSLAAYNILRPGAPTEAPDLVGQGSNVGQINKRWWADQKQKLAAAWRPDDWWEKPEDWRIIGSMLLSQDQISNEDLGKRLDSARIVKCPEKYGNNWAEAMSSDQRKNSKAAIDYIWQIRRWVGKPGGSKRKRDAA